MLLIVVAAVVALGLAALAGWVLRSRARTPVELAPEPPVQFRVLRDPQELEEALARAAAFEEATANVLVARLARYEKMATRPQVVSLHRQADTA